MKSIFHPHPLPYRIFISLLAAVFTFLLGWVIANNFSAGRFVRWEPFGTPPATVDTLVSVQFDESPQQAALIVLATNGRYFRGAKSLCSQDEQCWEEISQPEILSKGKLIIAHKCNSSYVHMTNPPGNPLSCTMLTDTAAGSHLLRDAYFVLLEDGTIWRWQFIPAMGAMIILFMSGVVAFFVTITVFLFLPRFKQM